MRDPKIFYALIRPMFGGALSTPQVEGIEAILNVCERNGVDDTHHVANILANVKRETGGYMSPIKETVMPYHKNKNPSDATVIKRLDNAFAKGQLKRVKTPYWRDGEFGRGQLQITHASNRRKFGITNRDDLLKLDVSARVAVTGMRDGMFRSDNQGPLSLSRYSFPEDLDNPPSTHPRRIVNGKDGSDAEISRDHLGFYAALKGAGWGEKAAKPAPVPVELTPAPAPYVPPKPAPVKPAPQPTPNTGLAAFGAILLAIGAGIARYFGG